MCGPRWHQTEIFILWGIFGWAWCGDVQGDRECPTERSGGDRDSLGTLRYGGNQVSVKLDELAVGLFAGQRQLP